MVDIQPFNCVVIEYGEDLYFHLGWHQKILMVPVEEYSNLVMWPCMPHYDISICMAWFDMLQWFEDMVQ